MNIELCNYTEEELLQAGFKRAHYSCLLIPINQAFRVDIGFKYMDYLAWLKEGNRITAKKLPISEFKIPDLITFARFNLKYFDEDWNYYKNEFNCYPLGVCLDWLAYVENGDRYRKIYLQNNQLKFWS